MLETKLKLPDEGCLCLFLAFLIVYIVNIGVAKSFYYINTVVWRIFKPKGRADEYK